MKRTKILLASMIVAGMTFFTACGEEKSEEEGKEEQYTEASAEEKDDKAEEEDGKQSKRPLSPRRDYSSDLVSIDWGAPSVRERGIWGELVPYGKLWRAGANETTAITFEEDVMLGETKVPAGTYGFFIMPNEEGSWTAIFNEKWNQEEHEMWGTHGYSDEFDVARVEVEPMWEQPHVETMSYEVKDGKIVIAWEKMKLEIPFSKA